MFDENAYRETFAVIHASEATRTEVLNMAKQTGNARTRRLPRRMLTLAAAIVLLLALGMTAYAAAGYEIPWWSVVGRQPELLPRAEEGAELLRQFAAARGLEENVEITGRVAHWDGPGSSDVYEYYYTVARKAASVAFYGTGELRAVDLREQLAQAHPGSASAVEYWMGQYPDLRAYAAGVEQAAPGVLDALAAAGLCQSGSGEILRVWCNPHGPFWGDWAECFVLLKDGSALELWLEPETLTAEGFRCYKPEDVPDARNGLFAAMQEGREEEWYADLPFSGVG